MLIGRGQDIPHLHQRILRLLDLPDGQVGIGIDQTGGQPQGQTSGWERYSSASRAASSGWPLK